MSNANKHQVAGGHYKSKVQHWDYVVANDLDYFQAQITKYVTRWKNKNGLQDLEKARHFLDKYMELVDSGEIPEPGRVYVHDTNHAAKVEMPEKKLGCGKTTSQGDICGHAILCVSCLEAGQDGEATPHYIEQDRR